MSQSVIQHKIEDVGGKKVKLTTKVTYRKIGRILSAVKSKLRDLIKRRSEWHEDDITAALKDPAVKNSI